MENIVNLFSGTQKIKIVAKLRFYFFDNFQKLSLTVIHKDNIIILQLKIMIRRYLMFEVKNFNNWLEDIEIWKVW